MKSRHGPPTEAGGQRRGSRGGGGRAAPAQAPLFVCAAPASCRRADPAGPGTASLPAARRPFGRAAPA